MQNAKDTFYEVLRDRVAAGNAGRTVVVRGVVRPAVVVDENEVPDGELLRDCFRLHWTALKVSAAGPAPMVAAECEVRYSTAGSNELSGLGRGRALAAMDAELAAAVSASPQWAQKKNFSGLKSGSAAVTTASRIWWSDVAFGAVTEKADALERKATVTVWSFQEVGER